MSSIPSKPVAKKQAELNDSTRGQWAMYATHRQSIERLLVSALPPARDGRLCVTGAGNCNDLDLAWLTQVFREVHLADIDPDALAAGIQRQRIGNVSRLHRHAPVDLTAIAPRVDAWTSGAPPDDALIDAALREAARAPAPPGLPAPFDVVLSPCLLSQLLNPARDAMGATHARFGQVLAVLRQRHLRLLLDLLRPGGTAFLVCDLSSTERFGPLARVDERELPDLMRTLLADGKCFRGLEPATIANDLRADPRIARYELQPPWLWHLGLERTYLVYAVRISASARPEAWTARSRDMEPGSKWKA